MVEKRGKSALSVRPLARGDWLVVERLFGERGACNGCWCMYWRLERGGKLWEESKGAPNRAAFEKRVQQGKVHAVMAFAGGEAIGWCSFGPRGSFPRLERSRVLRRQPPQAAAGAWSIVCFYVPARRRRQGVATVLLQAATERAFALGAREVEGYPVVPREAGATIPAAFAWTGVPELFTAAGYRPLAHRGETRPIMVKTAPP